MFYDINVMNSRTLGAAWRLANQMSGDTSGVGLTKICSSLNKCIESGRVSLRMSSVFVNGTARVYKKEAEELYRDCIKLNKEIIHRTNGPPIEVIESDSNSTKDDSRKIHRSSNSKGSYSSRKRNKPYHKQRSRSERKTTNNISSTNKINASKSSSHTTKDVGIQTAKSFISDRRKKYCPETANIDENQPFSLVVVCDTKSRIPRKIIYSNINVNSLY